MKVVNCRKEVCTHYCGRWESYHKALGDPVDLSVLGNPHHMMRESDRNSVIDKFEVDTLLEIDNGNREIIDALLSIPDDAVVGCFCAPKKCHCDTFPFLRVYARAKEI